MTESRGALWKFAIIPLIATLLVAWLPSAQGAAPPPPPKLPWTNLQYGFNMALLDNNTVARGMGYQWVSYTLGWDGAEPSPGVYDWGNANNIVNYARDARINVLIRVSRSPAWARDPACASSDTCPPANPANFGTFMNALAAHVRPLIAPYRVAYEIWNEPNTDLEWGGLCPDPARYTALVRAAYPNVKSADPNAIVAAGAVTTVGEQRGVRRTLCHMDDILFIQGMYAAGAAPYFDILSDHPYGFTNAPEADPMTTSPPLVFRRAERHRQIMEQNGDAAKQIWATEMGWAIDPRTLGEPCNPPDWYFIYTPEQQADYLVRAHQWARSYWPWMGAMFTFNFDFNEAPWYTQCHPFRFWSVKGRPAQAALQALVQSPPPTYTPAVDNPPQVAAVRYSSTAFNQNGGTLSVEVDATDNDNSAIASVGAVVQYPDGSTQVFPFTLISGNEHSGTWQTFVAIAPNSSQSTQAYTVSPYVVEVNPPGRTTNAPSQPISVTNTRFSDVPNDYWAYTYIEYLANAGIISGYSDNSFRPGNNATRGQFSKMIVLAEGWPIYTPPTPTFRDVPADHPFYQYIETAYSHGAISGYTCGVGCLEFRPGGNITRAQITKIIVLAEGWALENPPVPSFTDVAPGSAFYQYVETAYAHGIISGYSCGANCLEFRPSNYATRAQISKMLYLTLVGPGAPGVGDRGPGPGVRK